MSSHTFIVALEKAFSSYDIQAATSLYDPPLAIIHEHGTVLIRDQAALMERAETSFRDLKKAGIVRFELALLSEVAVGANLTHIRYQSTRHYADGSKDLPAYEAVVVREVDGVMRITASINPRSRWREAAGLPLV